MKVSDFHYELPDALIARFPGERRTDSRLLWLDGVHERLEHLRFADIGQLLRAGDLLVFNDTRVIRARMYGGKAASALWASGI